MRIFQIDTTNNRIYFDESGDAIEAVTPTGTGDNAKNIRLYFGRSVKTPDNPTDYVDTFLQFEMPMGAYPATPTQTQAQYSPGCVPNTLTITLPNPSGTEGAVTAAYNFIGQDFDYQDNIVSPRTLLTDKSHESIKYLSNNLLRYNRVYQPDEDGAYSTFPRSFSFSDC